MPLVLTFLILIAVFIIIVLSTIKFEIVDFELSNIIQITPKNYKIKLSFYLFEFYNEYFCLYNISFLVECC